MADEQQARDAEAALHLTSELLATVDTYIGRQPGGEMPVAVVADGVAGLAGSVAARGVEQLRAAGEELDAEQLPLEICRVLLGMLGGEADDAGEAPLPVGGWREGELAQAQALREALEDVLDERAQQETLSVDVVVDAVADLLMRTVRRVALQLVQAGDTDGAQTRLVACYRLVQRSLDTLAEGDMERKTGRKTGHVLQHMSTNAGQPPDTGGTWGSRRYWRHPKHGMTPSGQKTRVCAQRPQAG